VRKEAPPARGLFDVWSHFYDVPVLQSVTYRRAHAAVLAALRARGGCADVLDVGCGTGALARDLAREMPGRVVGCDLSRGMLRRAIARAPALAWTQGDALHLPFRERSFDAVTCTAAFHWFPDQRAALAEFRRVLRPGGCVALVVVSPAFAAVGTIVATLSGALGHPIFWPTPASLRADVAVAGLRLESEERLRMPPAPLLPPVLTIAARPSA
jgi:ubiquinone/menaquinone biosynthesis C-methylase UbiE